MTKEEVIALLRTSTDSTSWNHNCQTIKKAFGGFYPDWWYREVVQSGLMDQIMGPGASKIKIILG